MATKWQMETKEGKLGANGLVMSPWGRVLACDLVEPRGFEGGEPKYQVVVGFDGEVDLAALKSAAKNAVMAKFGDNVPKNVRSPFRDGDDDVDWEAAKGYTFVRFSSKFAVNLMDSDRSEIFDGSSIYPGCYVRVVSSPYAYDFAGNKGVAFGLRSVQKLADGEPIKSGAGDGSDMFGAVSSSSSDKPKPKGASYDEADGADLFD